MLFKYQTDSERIRPVLVAIGPYKIQFLRQNLYLTNQLKNYVGSTYTYRHKFLYRWSNKPPPLAQKIPSRLF